MSCSLGVQALEWGELAEGNDESMYIGKQPFRPGFPPGGTINTIRTQSATSKISRGTNRHSDDAITSKQQETLFRALPGRTHLEVATRQLDSDLVQERRA